jgi:hypothetical protein
MAMLGQEQDSNAARAPARRRGADQPPSAGAEAPPEQGADTPSLLPVNPGTLLRGLFGR